MDITRRAWLPALALTLNAFTWGVSWWPFRQLEAAGLHPLWATALIYAVAVVVITLKQPAAWSEPVSYTHLDVYKRQGRACRPPRP